MGQPPHLKLKPHLTEKQTLPTVKPPSRKRLLEKKQLKIQLKSLKYVSRSSFLVNLQACRLIAKLATLLTCELLHRYISTAFYPLPPFQSPTPPPPMYKFNPSPPHVLNTCGEPWDICPLGRWEILLGGEFLCGGSDICPLGRWEILPGGKFLCGDGNLRRSDFDHSNLF